MAKAGLESLQRQIGVLKAEAEKIKSRDKKSTLQEIARLMTEHDISINELRSSLRSDLSGPYASRLRGRKIKAMYRDPKTGKTWSGRGRLIGWLSELEKKGHRRSEFLIEK